MRKGLWIAGGILIGLGAAFLLGYWTLPVHRVNLRSDLAMLGDLNNDRRWDQRDKAELDRLLADPFSVPVLEAVKIDLNRNGRIDEEDLRLLKGLYTHSDPYAAEAAALRDRLSFPRPRELFRYIPGRRGQASKI